MSDATLGFIVCAIAALFGVWVVFWLLTIFAIRCIWKNVFRKGK